MQTHMASEEFIVTTPLKHKAKVRMKNLSDDVWDTSLFYANQVHRVGKFKGKDFAVEAATKKAAEIADAPPSTVSVICTGDGDVDPTCKEPTSATRNGSRIKPSKKNP